MSLLTFLKNISTTRVKKAIPIDPAKAYNIWAARYNEQANNLMLKPESKLFIKILSQTHNQTIASAKNGDRTFRNEDTHVAVENHFRSVDRLSEKITCIKFHVNFRDEKIIDHSAKHFC